jgi:hypothetical protein
MGLTIELCTRIAFFFWADLCFAYGSILCWRYTE